MRDRPAVEDVVIPPSDEGGDSGPDTPTSGDGRPTIARYRAVKVQSVIDVHSWGEAQWKGILYADHASAGCLEHFPQLIARCAMKSVAARIAT